MSGTSRSNLGNATSMGGFSSHLNILVPQFGNSATLVGIFKLRPFSDIS